MTNLIKKLITPVILILAVLTGGFIASKVDAKDAKHTNTQTVTFVQCVLVDKKVQSCTDITDGKLVDVEKIKEVYIK